MLRAMLLLLGVSATAQTGADLRNVPPTVAHRVEPDYTAAARRAGIEGTVELYAEIWPDGLAHKIHVIRGLGFGLDDKAIEALRRWRFSPGLKNGVSSREPATIGVVFCLTSNCSPQNRPSRVVFKVPQRSRSNVLLPAGPPRWCSLHSGLASDS